MMRQHDDDFRSHNHSPLRLGLSSGPSEDDQVCLRNKDNLLKLFCKRRQKREK